MSCARKYQEAIGECVANALDRSVAGEPVQISLHTQNTECPCARAAELQSRGHGGLKESPAAPRNPAFF